MENDLCWLGWWVTIIMIFISAKLNQFFTISFLESEDFDQILDTIYVGPVPEGRHIFVFQADPPDVTRIPEQDALGVTVVLLTCSYRGQEFVRVGYFINNDYSDAELRENPPAKPIFDRMSRNILASKPRVTRFKINWDDTPNGTEVNGIDDSEVPSTSDFMAQAEHMGVEAGNDGMEHDMCGGGGNGGMDENSMALPNSGINENSVSMEC
jgi:histone chaperone ASF1